MVENIGHLLQINTIDFGIRHLVIAIATTSVAEAGAGSEMSIAAARTKIKVSTTKSPLIRTIHLCYIIMYTYISATLAF